MGATVFLTIALCYLAAVAFMVIVERPLFAIYNRRGFPQGLTLNDLWDTTLHGIKSDFIVSAYISAPALLLLTVYYNWPGFAIMTILAVYYGIVAIALSLIVVGDTALYDFWKVKIDASVLSYLKSLKGVTASVSRRYLTVGLIGVVIVATIFFALELIALHIGLSVGESPTAWWWQIVGNVAIALTFGLLFLIIRGTGVRPNNQTMMYYSPLAILNHTSLNAAYNFIYSLSLHDDYATRFHYMSDDEAAEVMRQYYPTDGQLLVNLLTTDRPNVLVIVWESLSSRFVEPLGGEPGVTPRLNELCTKGVLFDSCDCASFLTDRGLAAILSGIPGQPTTSIVKYTKKLPNLPALPRRLRDIGYSTEVIHGGDLSIRQKCDYYLASGHDKLVTDSDFAKTAPRCKWGVHDATTFDYLYDDIMRREADGTKPWFITLQTLSSHEPFIVPEKILDNPMHNSMAYTDKHLGRFIDRLRATPAWADTLIVIVGDHGIHHGAEFGPVPSRDEYPRIPLILTGGAVKAPRRISAVMAQTDIPAIILGQMGLSHSEFPFSRDVLADTYRRPSAFHGHQAGLLWRDPEGFTFHSLETDTSVPDDPERTHRAQAVVQYLYRYLDKL